MKSQQFKTLIKEAVREVIQEELKDILLEAVRSPKAPVTENTYAQPAVSNPRKLSPEERKNMFSGIIGEMQQGGTATTAYSGQFNPQGVMPGSDLPGGEVGVDQIMNLMNR